MKTTYQDYQQKAPTHQFSKLADTEITTTPQVKPNITHTVCSIWPTYYNSSYLSNSVYCCPIGCVAATDGNSFYKLILQNEPNKKTPTHHYTSEQETYTNFNPPTKVVNHQSNFIDPPYQRHHFRNEDNYDKENTEFKQHYNRPPHQGEDHEIIFHKHISEKTQIRIDRSMDSKSATNHFFTNTKTHTTAYKYQMSKAGH